MADAHALGPPRPNRDAAVALADQWSAEKDEFRQLKAKHEAGKLSGEKWAAAVETHNEKRAAYSAAKLELDAQGDIERWRDNPAAGEIVARAERLLVEGLAGLRLDKVARKAARQDAWNAELAAWAAAVAEAEGGA